MQDKICVLLDSNTSQFTYANMTVYFFLKENAMVEPSPVCKTSQWVARIGKGLKSSRQSFEVLSN